MSSNQPQQPQQVFDFSNMDFQTGVGNFGTGTISANNIQVKTDTPTVQGKGKIHAAVFNAGSGQIVARGDIKVEKVNSSAAAAAANQTSTEPNGDEIIFVVSGYKFTVNRRNLVQNAPDFEVQFQDGNQFEINDVKQEVFLVLLNYLHKQAKSEELAQNAAGLLTLASRYELTDLKNQCQEFLKGQLSAEWAISLLKLAVECKAFKLKAAAIAFIKQHPELQNTDDFQQVAHMFK